MSGHLRMRALVAVLTVVLIGAVSGAVVAGCSALEEPDDASPPLEDATMSPAPGGGLETISWSEAANSVGQRLRVEGVVAGVKRGDGVTEVSIGLPAPDPQRFVAIVPDGVAKRFDAPLGDLFEGMLVRVTGTIVRSGDHTAVRVERPADLRLVQ